MSRVTAFVQNNRPVVGFGAGFFLIGVAAFPVLLGLGAAVGVGVLALVVVATIGIYRASSGARPSWVEPLSRSRLLLSALAGAAVVGLVIQAVPYGWDRSNPAVTAEPAWDSPRTRELAVRACFDCHSNEVVYPWYAKVAPMSWAVQAHVDEGRAKVNYSEWDRPQEEADESAETVIEGEMPPFFYTFLTHREARLTEAEKRALADGFRATLGSGDRGEDEDDD
jgi:mono/diheme cytochrome c family protein